MKIFKKRNENEPKPEYSIPWGILLMIGIIVLAMIACIIVIVHYS